MTVTNEHKAKILEKAAEVIEERGFYKGDYMPPGDDPATCPVCLLGAINVAAGLPPDGCDPDAPYDVGEAVYEVVENLTERVDFAPVHRWSDHAGRTAEQVISELRACAAELRGGAT